MQFGGYNPIKMKAGNNVKHGTAKCIDGHVWAVLLGSEDCTYVPPHQTRTITRTKETLTPNACPVCGVAAMSYVRKRMAGVAKKAQP